MGEAKRRGTFEQRKASAIKRNAEIVKLAGATERQIIPPEERKRRMRVLLPLLYGIGVSGPAMMRGRYHK